MLRLALILPAGTLPPATAYHNVDVKAGAPPQGAGG